MKKSRVAENFFLVLQLGISMIVPVLLCTALGLLIDKRFHTKWLIVFIILGVLTGFRSVYVLVRREVILAKKEQEEEKPEWAKKAFGETDDGTAHEASSQDKERR